MSHQHDGEQTRRVDTAVLAELDALRQRLPELSGSVVSTADGMLVAHDAFHLQPDAVAALAATHLGLAQRFADTVGHGALREVVVQSDGGYITTYAVGTHTVLTVLSAARANVARVHLEARRTAERLGGLLVAPGLLSIPAPSPPVSWGPLARRTPMATLADGDPGYPPPQPWRNL